MAKRVPIDDYALELHGDPDMTTGDGMQPVKDVRDDSGNQRGVQQVQSKPMSDKQRGRLYQVKQPGDPDLIYDEETTGQTGIIYGVPQAPLVMITDPTVITLYKKYITTYDAYREIRKDPTVALCRAVIVGPILSSTWSVKSADDVPAEITKFIQDQLLRRRFRIMENSLYGCIDFGWQGFEKIFETVDYDVGAAAASATDMTDPKTGKHIKPKSKMEKLIGLRKLKPLLQDMTSIMVYIYNGDFAGFRQGIVFVEAPRKTVLINIRVEGTMWHGYPLLEDVRESVYKWSIVEEGAQRYDKKVAGSHFVVYYPLGKSMSGGVERDNHDIARDILHGLEASGNIAIPSTLLSFVEGMENTDEARAWKVDFLSDRGARQSSFVDRLKYLDTQKARAMHVPERAIMEGQFGTKAEAEGHQDIMTVLLENMDYRVTEGINFQLVDHLLEINWGKEMRGKVWLESPPISDDKINYVRNTLTAMLGNPNGFTEMFPYFDFGQMMDLCEVPKNKDVVKPSPEEQNVGQGPPGLSGMDPAMAARAQAMGLKPGGPPAPLNRLLQAIGSKAKANGANGNGGGFGGEKTGPQVPGPAGATPGALPGKPGAFGAKPGAAPPQPTAKQAAPTKPVPTKAGAAVAGKPKPKAQVPAQLLAPGK